MKKVILTPNPYRDKGFQTVRAAQKILLDAGMETRICLPFEVDKTFDLPKDIRFSRLDREIQNSDLIICFGGDGTILHMAKAATRKNVPILGVNIGTMGFMAELESTELDQLARSGNWLRVFEMAESIGGRTSVTSIVGHLPAALAGVDFRAFLAGACHMDNLTREANLLKNPAYMLSAMWYLAGNGKGDRNMVIVPYSDRLILMSRYLQQLVMESLGKELDLDGNTVHQGLNVFGNKGGTDAHAFIQQLNDGRNDFFITFIEVLRDRAKVDIAPGVGMGDFLHGFMTGLSNALRGKGRSVIEMRMDDVNEFNLGMLIAIYERAVAAYAELIHINAFHQPGVQAYKLASKSVIKLLTSMEEKLAGMEGFSGTAGDFAAKLELPEQEYEIEGILAKLSVNNDRRSLGFDLIRTWDPVRSWVYTVRGK